MCNGQGPDYESWSPEALSRVSLGLVNVEDGSGGTPGQEVTSFQVVSTVQRRTHEDRRGCRGKKGSSCGMAEGQQVRQVMPGFSTWI